MDLQEMGMNRDVSKNAESRKERVRRLLRNHEPIDYTSKRLAQETYVKKLREDIDRTKSFLNQAQKATAKLQEENAGYTWDENTRRNARIIALYETYRTLPYTAMKNDLIGIATAASLTKRAVVEQQNASDEISRVNTMLEHEITHQKQIQADYSEISTLLQQQIRDHPQKMDLLRNKLSESQPVEVEIQRKLKSVQTATQSAKKVEERLFNHVKRVVTKVHALQDWENASVMDEETFSTSIVQSVSLVVTLVTNLLVPDKWVAIVSGGAEEKLVLVMIRNNLVHVRGNEVRLRDYGFEE